MYLILPKVLRNRRLTQSYEASPDGPSSSNPSSTLPVSPLTPNPAPHKSNAGIIAGTTVGGVAILAAIILGIVFLLRRNRRNNHTSAQADVPAPETQPPQPPAPMPQSPGWGHATPFSPAPPYAHPYGGNEKSMGYEQGGYGQDMYAAHHNPPQEISEMAGSVAEISGQTSAVAEMPVSKS